MAEGWFCIGKGWKEQGRAHATLHQISKSTLESIHYSRRTWVAAAAEVAATHLASAPPSSFIASASDTLQGFSLSFLHVDTDLMGRLASGGIFGGSSIWSEWPMYPTFFIVWKGSWFWLFTHFGAIKNPRRSLQRLCQIDGQTCTHCFCFSPRCVFKFGKQGLSLLLPGNFQRAHQKVWSWSGQERKSIL